ncbi:glycoside hydrolase family 71 protein [Mycena crocata]|nr:glycoside hydrolase family 71 protein [Mycena crocata]
MRPFNLLLHSFGFLFCASSVVSTPLSDIGSFGSDSSGQSDPTPVESPPPSAPVSTSSNLVVAHFMVGNTYRYEVDDWVYDIGLAASKGINSFALNIGNDEWQETQVQKAFTAAKTFDFNLFPSFDMGSMPCSLSDHASLLRKYIAKYHDSASYQRLDGKPLVSAFSGQDCKFGQRSTNEGWEYAIKQAAPEPIHFVPSFFVDPSTFHEYSVIDGAFNWNASWPMGDHDVDFAPDNSWIANLGKRTYMTGVSPWFFTHYGPDSYNKNFIYLADNWMLARRWELLIANRDRVAVAQVITWNDFGESHYVGPLLQDSTQPRSEAWVNGFDHIGWLDLFAHYIQAYKTGAYPAVSRDRIFLWARLYPAEANAPDSIGPPFNHQWTKDYLWAIVMLTDPAEVVLQCGDTREKWTVPSGLSKLKLPLKTTCAVTAFVRRGDKSVIEFSPRGFEFRTDPPTYNFNAFVAASP